MEKTRLTPWLFFALLMSGCSVPGDNIKSETDVSKEATEKVKATHDSSVKTSKPTPAIGGNISLDKDASLTLNYHGLPPIEEVETKVEKNTQTSSVMDYSLREVHEAVSAWYWLILMISAGMGWKLYKAVVNSKEFAALRGALGIAQGVIGRISSEIEMTDPGSVEHRTLLKQRDVLQHEVQQMHAQMDPKRPYHG